MMKQLSQKAWPGIIIVWLLLLASCSRAPATPTPTADMTSQPEESPEAGMTPTSTVQAGLEQDEPDLDLRFANVTRVEFEHLSGDDYRFSVTLYHDDDGEAPNFADAWQVEDLQGNVLGRRELLHSHGTQPFTRSHTITIPAGLDTVLVRGHDMTHGFGGQAMEVNLSTGESAPLQTEPGS